jgi:hypothetical protein
MLALQSARFTRNMCDLVSHSSSHIMVTAKPYYELGAGYFASLQDPERETRRLIARLQALGHTVTLNPAA